MKYYLLLLAAFGIYADVFSQGYWPEYTKVKEERFGDGQYWEDDAINYQNYPYTTFDQVGNISIEQQKRNVKALIVYDKGTTPQGEFYRIYKSLWDFAWTAMPDNVKPDADGPGQRATWAKAHAFIYYLNIDPDGHRFDSMYDAGGFAWVAERALQTLAYDVPADADNLLTRSRELLAAVQAYDLLKAAGRLQNDRNHKDLTVRDNLRRFTRNLFKQATKFQGVLMSTTGYRKNHGISVCAALGTSACVFNECGAGYWNDRWKAAYWGRLAHWGMMECLFDAPDYFRTSQKGGIYGYSEGPGYFSYCMIGTAIPFFKTFNNFVTSSHNSWVSPYGAPSKNANNVKNYMHDQDIRNLYEWYFKIQRPNGSAPTYDNSFPNLPNVTGIFDPAYNVGDSVYNLDQGNVDLRVDYLAALGGIGEKGRMRPSTSNDLKGITQMDGAGNMILRMNQDSVENRQYFLMLHENGVAFDAGDAGAGHEDDDVGSFILAVDKDELAVDPAYLGFDQHIKTSKYLHHNVILFDNSSSMVDFFAPFMIRLPTTKIYDVKEAPDLNAFSLSIQSVPYFNLFAPTGPAINRNVNQIRRSNGMVYYLLNDHATGNLNTHSIQWQLNGNGNIYDFFKDNANYSTFTLDTSGTNRIYKWRHPCSGYKLSGKWNLYANVGVMNSLGHHPDLTTITSSSEDGTNHGNINLSKVLYKEDWQVDTFKIHTRVMIKQYTDHSLFQSVLIPYRCGQEGSLPVITRTEKASSIVTQILFPDLIDTSFEGRLYKRMPTVANGNTVHDTDIHVHYVRWEGMQADTLVNPFKQSTQTSKLLTLNAKSVLIRYSTFALNGHGIGFCPPSSSNFRHISFNNGSYVRFGDTDYIRATRAVNADITISGRYYYTGSFKSLSAPSSTDSIKFFLPDIGRCVEMDARNATTLKTLPGQFDTTTNIFTLLLPDSETKFVFQEKLTCADCYFPPTWHHIDTIFSANDRNQHRLGHKLSITNPYGSLDISNSTKITFCPGVYLQNKKTIHISGPCQTKGFILKKCAGVDSLAAGSDNSAIILDSASALVLENGSSTYIGRGGAIYVKSYGSLIIKNGAFVRIGDTSGCGFGSIIADKGSYVYIEPYAHIEYGIVPGDTVDKNIFNISVTNPPGVAFAGVYLPIDTVLKLDSILPAIIYPIAICALDTINPILNREWGYTNFGVPLATFQTRNDTLCPGEPFQIKLNRILNDARYQIYVCRMDSIHILADPRNGVTDHYIDTCVFDTIVHDSLPSDPVCTEPRTTPDEWLYHFAVGTRHRVSISVWSDCGLQDDTVAYIYMADTVNYSLNMADTICEGIGTLKAHVTDISHQAGYYTWEVSELVDTANIFTKLKIEAKSYSENFYGYLPDSFDFPNYLFNGGRRYLVSLSMVNSCGRRTSYDTVNVPLGARILLERPKVYNQLVAGATSVKLHGYVNAIDSFRWQPTTWLDTPTVLTPISSPSDSMMYVLIVHGSGCVATDTTYIKYNRHANAGYSDTLCFDNNTVSTERLLGFPYDMSLLLGMMYYYNPTGFMSYYNTYNITNDPTYFRYFTHFMHFFTFQANASGCPVDLYNAFTNNLNKEAFFKGQWYKSYYQSFTTFSDNSLPALSIFTDTVNHNSVFSGLLTTIDNWGSINPCMDNIFTAYNDFVLSHSTEITAGWSKIVEGDTSLVSGPGGSYNYFVVTDAPTKSSRYILSVITPDVAEMDEIVIILDTILAPNFDPGLTFDSTVYFNNNTTRLHSIASFEWNFGDGSSHSFDVNPVHTFPAFDTFYVVSLSATNLCGTVVYMDTVWIDSAHWGGSFLKSSPVSTIGKVGNQNLKQEIEAHPKTPQSIKELLIPMSICNYPNPFNENTIIDYQILQPYGQAELHITDVLGQIIFSQSLKRPVDKIQFDGTQLKNGLYYYSLVLDGSVKQTKIMSVIH